MPAEVDFRTLPIADAIRWLAENGEPADPRPDIDDASLRRRFPRLAAVETSDVSVEGPNGPVPARLYGDASARSAGRALVWVHGGAFLGGHLDMPESHWVALELAARGIRVLAVDYTKCLGDVHFPVPSDDVLAAWRYALAHAEELFGLTPDAVLLGGASAGGNLTAGATARLRDAREPVRARGSRPPWSSCASRTGCAPPVRRSPSFSTTPASTSRSTSSRARTTGTSTSRPTPRPRGRSAPSGTGWRRRDDGVGRTGHRTHWREPAPASRRMRLRLRNEEHIVTGWYRSPGGEWTRHGVRYETSGYHANTMADLLSLRPALYASGEGRARFRDFRYRPLGR